MLATTSSAHQEDNKLMVEILGTRRLNFRNWKTLHASCPLVLVLSRCSKYI
jgi:hypothetical protein